MKRKPTEQEKQYRKYTRAQERHIEWEIALYHRNKDIVDDYVGSIADGGRSKDVAILSRACSDPGDPTAIAGARLADTVWLGELRDKVRAVERVLNRLSQTGRKFVDLWFWRNTRNVEEIKAQCNIERSACYKWRKVLILHVGIELGWVDPNQLSKKAWTMCGLFAA